MNDNHKPMTHDQTEIIVPLTITVMQGNEPPLKTFVKKMGKTQTISAILIKRIKVFKLPRFEPSAIIMLEVLSEGNPGKAILGLVEVMEKYDEYKPNKIDIGFISSYVFPWGFFSEEYAKKLYDLKRYDKGKKYKYSPLFC